MFHVLKGNVSAAMVHPRDHIVVKYLKLEGYGFLVSELMSHLFELQAIAACMSPYSESFIFSSLSFPETKSTVSPSDQLGASNSINRIIVKVQWSHGAALKTQLAICDTLTD